MSTVDFTHALRLSGIDRPENFHGIRFRFQSQMDDEGVVKCLDLLLSYEDIQQIRNGIPL